MQVRCPHCRNPIEVIEEASLTDIPCDSCGSSFNLAGELDTLERPKENRTIGHFELVRRLGVGAFGEVWLANDSQLDRSVAVKIPRKLQLEAGDSEQFFREARAAAQLKHANIVSVYEIGRQDGHIYIVSELVQGVTLADRIQAGAISSREAAELCSKVANALQHAHEHGVIHRDLKPSNIMLDEKHEPHVMDFGLAKREAAEITMTVEGQLLGTPAYMSPEQAKGDAHNADARSDVYSLGVVLFELVTAERPFRGNQRMLIHQLLTEDAPSPRKFNATVSRDFETICLKCLEKDPDRRYQSAQELEDELRRFLDGEPIRARPISRAARGWRWCHRNPLTAGLTGVIALILVVGIFVSSYFAVLANDRATTATKNAKRADKEKTRADKEAAAADTARQDAEELVAFMLGDLRNRLEPLGRLDVMTGVGEVITDYYQQRREGLNDAAADIRYSKALGVLTEIASELGQYKRALELNSERSKVLKQHETPAEAVKIELERERADVFRQKARIQLDMKNAGGAAAALKTAIGILADLEVASDDTAEGHLQAASLLGEHSVALARQGDEQESRSQLLQALDHLKKAKASTVLNGDECLIEIALLLQSDQLSVPVEEIPFEVSGNSSRIEAERQLKTLIDANPDDYRLKFKTVQLLHRLSADIRGEAYFVAERLCAELVVHDPSNQRWRELQAELKSVIGYELTQLGQREQALPYVEQGLETLKQLVLEQPKNPRVLHRLAMAYRFMGWWQLGNRDYPAAQASFRMGIETIQPLMQDDSDDAGLAYTFTFLHIWLGEALRVPGEKAAAIRPVIPHIDRIGSRLPGDEAIQLARFQAHDRLSDFLLKMADPKEAERQNAMAREAIQTYRTSKGKDAKLRRLHAQGWRTRARLLWSNNRRDEALEAYRETAIAQSDLVEKPELHARANYMSGLCGSLNQFLYCPSDDVARDLDFVYKQANVVESYLSDIEAEENRLPAIIRQLRNVWKVAAIQAGKTKEAERQAKFWSHFVGLTKIGLELSAANNDVCQTIRNDSLALLLGDRDLRRFAEKNGTWNEIIDQAIELGKDSTKHDDSSAQHWRLLANVHKLKADWHRGRGDSDDAIQQFVQYESAARRALKLEQDQFEVDDWRRYVSHHLVGHALLGQRRFEDAETVLTEGVSGLERLESNIPNGSKNDYIMTVDRLVELYRTWGKTDQADKWQSRAERLK